MELLLAEINRKRKISAAQIDEITKPDQKVGNTRYFRQGDLKHLELEKKKAEQQALDIQRSKRKQNPHVEDEEDEKSRILRETISEKSKILDSLLLLDTNEIKNRLRNLMQPVTLFGETGEERRTRLSVVLSEEGEDDDYRLTSNYDTKNHFLTSNKKKENKVNKNNEDDDDDDDDEDASISKSNKTDKREDVNKNDKADDNDVDGDGDEEEDKTPSTSFKKGEIATHYSTTPGLSHTKIVYKYFRNLLKQWEWDLDDRDVTVKNTAKAKMETRTQKQCKDYIRPLFKLCKKNEVPLDILDKLLKIVTACENGDFRLAHDQYLQAAIGNAAWPIGLTMVGIHERSGREKISTSKVAHVMNNELQRKYFTSVKRLMTYAQNKRTDVLPSMKSL